jgi:hypothetical protein
MNRWARPDDVPPMRTLRLRFRTSQAKPRPSPTMATGWSNAQAFDRVIFDPAIAVMVATS